MKTWLITGTSSGLGRLMTEALLDRGDRVAATVRDSAALDDLSARHGGRLRVLVTDLTHTVTMRREIDTAFAVLGRIDVVVSNAAYGLFGPPRRSAQPRSSARSPPTSSRRSS